jgi:hypothetical protein
MHKIIDLITDIFWWLVWILINGLVIGLGVFLTILFTRYAFLWALLITTFFVPFHWSDLKTFYFDKNWLALIGRSICLYAISSFLIGFVAFVSGLIEITFDLFDVTVFYISVSLSFICVSGWAILVRFFPASRLYTNIKKTFDGLYKLGILWHY